MKVFKDITSFSNYRESLETQNIGFVPTMGALHEGHLSLIRKSQADCDLTFVSIYVNPTQFNNANDLQKYPNTLEQDMDHLESMGVDVLLLPDYKQIYPHNFEVQIDETTDSRILCGQHRPGHFKGVLSVVNKLLNLVKAKNCYMGEKDYQQYYLVKKMTESLFMSTKIIPCPTVREFDGLAMSSRNLRLSSIAREKAPLIYKLLTSKEDNQTIKNKLTDAGFKVDYVEDHWGRKFVAASIEEIRLIDNV